MALEADRGTNGRACQPGVGDRHTYIPVRPVFVYLAVILDWASPRELSWDVSSLKVERFDSWLGYVHLSALSALTGLSAARLLDGFGGWRVAFFGLFVIALACGLLVALPEILDVTAYVGPIELTTYHLCTVSSGK